MVSDAGGEAWREGPLDFGEFVAARGAAMLAMARVLVRDDADARDLVQDVLAKALLKWGTIRRAGDPVAYVNRMLFNAAMSFWRRGVRREYATPVEDLRDVALTSRLATGAGEVRDPAEQVVERDALLQALRTLPARHRAVLVLRYYEGMHDAEIAALLGMAQATVRSSAARGLLALRRAGLLGASTPAIR